MPADGDITVLLVDDDAGDAALVREALDVAGIEVRLEVVEDGIEAMSYLRREDPYADSPMPDLVLLDLNMPRKGGLEVLAELKDDDALKSIPVVVLTTSDSEVDVHESYARRANAFVVKPLDFDRFTKAILEIDEFFIRVARRPGSK